MTSQTIKALIAWASIKRARDCGGGAIGGHPLRVWWSVMQNGPRVDGAASARRPMSIEPS